jgi:hypothetical protein
LRELGERWQWDSARAIQDADIVTSYSELNAAARERLPNGADAMAYVTGSNPDEASARFRSDLDFVLGKLRQFKNVVSAHSTDLARVGRPWWKRTVDHLKPRKAKVAVAAPDAAAGLPPAEP